MRIARITSYDKFGMGMSAWRAEGQDDVVWAVFVHRSERGGYWSLISAPEAFHEVIKRSNSRIPGEAKLALHTDNPDDKWTEHDLTDPIVPPEVVAIIAGLELVKGFNNKGDA